MTDHVAIEKWSARVILLFSTLFIGWFFFTELDGLREFINYLFNAIATIPDALDFMRDYYRQLTSNQLFSSLGLGILFGVCLSYIVLLNIQTDFELPIIRLREVLGAFLVGWFVYQVDRFLLNMFFIILVAAYGIGFIFQPQKRNKNNIRIVIKNNRNILFKSILLGVIGGVLGSQLFTYPTRHCTYATDAPSVEYQIGVFITFLGVIVVLLPFWTYLSRQKLTNRSTGGHFKGIILPSLFLLPTLLSLIVFLYYPVSEIVTTSLGQSNPRLPGRTNFVCLDNYVRLAEDIAYRNALSTTFIITIVVVIVAMSVALGIALIASQKVKGVSIYRTLLIWPYALSPVVAGAIFLALFDQQSGIINTILSNTFNIQINWFTDTTPARVLIILASVWNILGFNILFYIAGLQNIPQDLIEAAQIDGANIFQRFFRITLPLLSPFTFFLLVTNVTYSFYGIYGAIDVLTQGGPVLGAGGAGGATEVLIYALYSGNSQAGMAASQAIVLFFLVTAITVIQFRFVERRVTYTS